MSSQSSSSAEPLIRTWLDHYDGRCSDLTPPARVRLTVDWDAVGRAYATGRHYTLHITPAMYMHVLHPVVINLAPADFRIRTSTLSKTKSRRERK